MYTSKRAILQGTLFTLTSYSNGAAYVLRGPHGDGFATVWVEGGDAIELQGEIDSLETIHPDWTPDEILGKLWEQGYDSVATPETVV